MAPVLEAVLPKAKFERKFPRAILFGQKSACGLGLQHPWFQQGSLHLLTLLTGLRNPDWMSSKFSLQSLEIAILEVGTTELFLNLDFHTFDVLTTESWLKCLWQFM